jgi:hypothetical protein
MRRRIHVSYEEGRIHVTYEEEDTCVNLSIVSLCSK